MADMVFDLVIIGNGVSGNSAVLAAHKADPGLNIAIFSEENYPAYSAGALPDFLSDHLTLEDVLLLNASEYNQEKVHIFLGEKIDSIDTEAKTVATSRGNTVRYNKLIIATGSMPVQLRSMQGTNLPGNYILKTITDVERMKAYPAKSAVVVGSGAIGMEAALALKERGLAVTIVELLDWVNKKSLDAITAELVVKELEAKGLTIYTGENVTAVEGTDRVESVTTNKRTIVCDLVLWAIGVRPVVDLAKKTGLDLGETGGIKVDEYMRTSITDLYACGDCTESMDQFRKKPSLNMLWESAVRQGIVAGGHCAGLDNEFDGSFAVLITYIGDKPIVAFGMTEGDLIGTQYDVLEKYTADSYRRILLQDERIAGVQMINTMEGAGILLAQLKKGAPIEKDVLAQSEHIRYPAQQAALSAYLDRLA